MVSSNETTFQSGSTNGSVCLTTQILMDNLIEVPEVLLVTFNSDDEAVMIDQNTATITIVDSEGKVAIHKLLRISSSKDMVILNSWYKLGIWQVLELLLCEHTCMPERYYMLEVRKQ